MKGPSRRRRRFVLWGLLLVLSVPGVPKRLTAEPDGSAVDMGSKKFTESVILGELATHLAGNAGAKTVHRRELGGTQILWNALLKGEIDVYPEYTGTISEEILAGSGLRGEAELRAGLLKRGIRMSRPLGFNNTYAIGVRETLAEQLHLETISDLIAHPGLKFGFSNEFMDREDGWPGLRGHYGLPQKNVTGLDHDLAYRGLEGGSIQATDLYSTDAEIKYYRLRVLKDDRHYFPEYQAVWLYREDLASRHPGVVRALESLEGRIDEAAMIAMNGRAKLDRVPESRVAADFLATTLQLSVDTEEAGAGRRLVDRTLEHLSLVAVSLLAAILVAVPLGVLAAYRPGPGQVILAAAGVVQTIPSLALLVFMIPWLGIGAAPAVVALFLYSLLPIVRNTYSGLRDVAQPIRDSALALGLPFGARLFSIELPMASRSILSGIKTSAVINVGTATLGAIIGAGGYGQPILTGIRLDDVGLILEGAVPAAVLALLVQGLFEVLDGLVVPKGLRLKSQA